MDRLTESTHQKDGKKEKQHKRVLTELAINFTVERFLIRN